ncbi:phosphopantetheine-binding protein [Halioxenophilus aromaticivorans]|uniref:Xanthomonadin biosynthesis acyl carrier protein XanC n=1 Tax=Halioxenophilus aromaticivorans TaxID=1306992 RepID=A0AAV3U0C1_9ALTE
MTSQTAFETEIASLLIEALDLEDKSAQDINPTEPLFGEGLGLDSIDALEIALAISQKYGIQMKAEEEQTKEAFYNLQSLCAFIEQRR